MAGLGVAAANRRGVVYERAPLRSALPRPARRLGAVMMTAGVCVATGIYLAECDCGVKAEFRRGQTAPRCPKCGDRVIWVLLRPTYQAHSEGATTQATSVPTPSAGDAPASLPLGKAVPGFGDAPRGQDRAD